MAYEGEAPVGIRGKREGLRRKTGSGRGWQRLKKDGGAKGLRKGSGACW